MSRPVILCIDDEDLGLEIRKMVLEREGFSVLTARDGATGISVFDSARVDAVVLDYAMPGMDGGQVAAILPRAVPGEHELPVRWRVPASAPAARGIVEGRSADVERIVIDVLDAPHIVLT